MGYGDLERVAEKVHDLASFIDFLEALMKDWNAANNSENVSPSSRYESMAGWENTTIGSFLEAAIAGARGNKIGPPGGTLAEKSAWRQAAEIMLLGKVYE